MDYRIELFTTNFEDGWIEVVKRNETAEKVHLNENSISIVATGWVNETVFESPDGLEYVYL